MNWVEGKMAIEPNCVILVRYAEIALKGANRHIFERQLRDNIRDALALPRGAVRQQQAQILVTVPDGQKHGVLEKLGHVFGIAWYTDARICPNTMEGMSRAAVEAARGKIDASKRFAIRANRSEKRLPFTSIDMGRQVGEAVRTETGASVDLDHPDVAIYVDAGTEQAYVYSQRYPGPGGLPVGTSGKVLSLLSGGPDSIASSYLLAKRGAQVDYLHFHVFPGTRPVLESKMVPIATRLSTYTLSRYMFLSSYLPFEMRVLGLTGKDQAYELIVFRRLMARVAEAFGTRHGYQAIVLGDSLGQVASQTMENIVAVDEAVSLPVFRPLIGMDKIEILDLVQDIGLFDVAAARYKDCCSLIAPNPVIKAYLPRVHGLEERLDIEKIVDSVVDGIEPVAVSELN
jgi:thiamine biosynthesis protein ThiI